MTLSATARDVDRSDPGRRAWVARAIRAVQADANRSADTHLLPVQLPQAWGIELYLKDESTHPSGSLKHRLARSLFLYALCNGWVGPDTPIIEASSGSTAVSEAWFARLLGLEFIAVMPRSTSQTKIDLIERNGGRCEFIDDPATLYPTAVELARRLGGHYMDQFTYAERATDWRGNNNIAESIFDQLRLEPHPAPAWIVTAAGTGGTSATIGRHLRYGGHLTRLCVTDPENSAFSIAGIHVLRSRTGLFAGGSTGTNLFGALKLVCEMRARGEHGSVVTLLCDGGGRYADSYYSRDWLSRKGLDVDRWVPTFERAWDEGVWVEP
ncbi:PLP-dependent cysteine synthase family protein [Arsenicicoccus cauae]|uniref:cystathionine gamma-lyase n=1 Tax=Arsenicicoccus cauae TaxID=2663847 RepID=A0A6I3I9W0_9MICO|nr:pyridoxal-phosphate dependent enzyme [Arsenicicoccus cauae]MTB70978.1 pyridoxal-phosphate dependent enzyme [Arsenicicoccus cauae]